MSGKLTIEQIKGEYFKEGFIVLQNEYFNRNSPIRCLCPRGHELTISWGQWLKGSRCKLCSQDSSRNTFDVVKKSFEEAGYILLETEYKNVSFKMKYRCPQGHEGEISYRNWKQGVRCKYCHFDKLNDVLRIKTEQVKSALESEGYVLLEKEIKDSTTPFEFKCSRGHIHFITWEKWKQGSRCAKCSWEVLSEKKRVSIEIVRKAFEEEGYTLLETEFLYRHNQLKFICPKGHKYSITWNNWCLGHRCGKCSSNSSKAENEIAEYYKDLQPFKSQKIITPLELDLYFEQQKIAIEYCGLYWHSIIEDEKHKRITPSYHYQKLKACNEKGIRLITIFEDEWVNNKELCLSRINAALGINQKRIFARKCRLEKISSKEAKQFLQSYHLQGSSGRRIAFGLFYEGLLVSVMTLGLPSRAHVSKEVRTLELKRFASLPNYIVVGGASKLFKAAIVYAKLGGYRRIVSYCDLRWGTGTVYKKLGMILIRTSKYTPHYTDFVRRWRNQSFARNRQKSEKERVQKAEVYKIYDCGHQTWVYELVQEGVEENS